MRVAQTFTLNLEVVQQLESFAKEKETPKSHIVEKAILEYLKTELEKQKSGGQ